MHYCTTHSSVNVVDYLLLDYIVQYHLVAALNQYMYNESLVICVVILDFDVIIIN
jgi:hypothetical protein